MKVPQFITTFRAVTVTIAVFIMAMFLVSELLDPVARSAFMSRHVVGIDLGTTNSVVATVDDSGTVVILPNADGGPITPSVVYFEPDGTALVGGEAVRETAFDPDNGIRLVKRYMGTEFPLHIREQRHTPESVSALILRQLVSAATGEGGNGAKVSAVITVPAYFGLAEREATHQAGVIAGLDVLELLDEPVAAATHYGLTTGGDRTVLVYDLGGGTFDTTVLRIEDGAVRVAGHRRPPPARRRRRRPPATRPGDGTASRGAASRRGR